MLNDTWVTAFSSPNWLAIKGAVQQDRSPVACGCGMNGLRQRFRRAANDKEEEDEEKMMSTREQYEPGPASGAQIHQDGEEWTLILVRELGHSPEKFGRR